MNDIRINVTFHEGRCFFNGFNPRNDVNPETGKAGVDYYRFYLIGWILERLGCILERLRFARGVHCFHHGKPKIVFVKKSSFLEWREKHSTDEYITFMDFEDIKGKIKTIEDIDKMEKFYKKYERNPEILEEIEGDPQHDFLKEWWDDAAEEHVPRPLNEQEIRARAACQEKVEKFNQRKQEVLDFYDDFEGSIKFIIKSYKVLPYNQVIEKAEQELPEGQYKEKKIKDVKRILERCGYKESYAIKQRPYIVRPRDSDHVIDNFLRGLPGIILTAEK